MTEEKAREKVESRQIVDHSKIAITSIVRNEEANGNLKKFLGCCQELEKYHDILIEIKTVNIPTFVKRQGRKDLPSK